jgi:uncharacterized membrane protein YdjX (TVP38/TMEM64 family)
LVNTTYFAGVAEAGFAASVAGFEAFLFFFTCFFAAGAVVVPVAGAAVCAASVNPAVAKVRESPSNTELIFFMMFYPVLFLRRFVSFLPLTLLTEAVLTHPERQVK